MHWLASFCVRVCLCVFVSENSKLENQKTMKTHISLANLCASGILEFRHDWSCFAVLNCGHCYCCRCIAIAIAVYCSPLLSYYLLRPLLLLSLHCTSVSRRRIVLYLFSHSVSVSARWDNYLRSKFKAPEDAVDDSGLLVVVDSSTSTSTSTSISSSTSTSTSTRTNSTCARASASASIGTSTSTRANTSISTSTSVLV